MSLPVTFNFSTKPLVTLQESLVLTHSQLSERVKTVLDQQVELLSSDKHLKVPVLRLTKTASEYGKDYNTCSGQRADKKIAKLLLAQAKMEESVVSIREEWGDRVLMPVRNAFNGAMDSLYLPKLLLDAPESEKLNILNVRGQCVGMSRTFEHLVLRVREKKGALNRNDAIRIAALLSGGATAEAAIEQSGEHYKGGCKDGFFVVPIVLTPQADLSPGFLSFEQISANIDKEFGIYDYAQNGHRVAVLQTDDGSTLQFEPQGGLIDITGQLEKRFAFESFKSGRHVKAFQDWKAKYTVARDVMIGEIFLNKIEQPELIEATRGILDNWITSDHGFKHRRFAGINPAFCQAADKIFQANEKKLMQNFWRLTLEYYQLADQALRPARLP